jgi:hypothetical protein
MCDGALSEILKAEQRSVWRLADLTDGLDAGKNECIPNPRRKSDVVDQCIVRKLWSGKQKLGHSPLRLQSELS